MLINRATLIITAALIFAATSERSRLNLAPQAYGLGHVDRALHLSERDLATRPASRPHAFVADLLPIGSLRPVDPWAIMGSDDHDIIPPPRSRPRATAPPRFGTPEGYVPLGGVYW